MTLIPNYLTMAALDLVDSNAALVLPSLGSGFATFFLRQQFRNLPREYDEAALVDGASRLAILWRITVPLSRPAIAAMAIFQFLSEWTSFLWPLIATTSPEMRTLETGLAALYDVAIDDGIVSGPVVMAGAVLVMAPGLLPGLRPRRTASRPRRGGRARPMSRSAALIAAHRGGAREVAENSRAAFRHTVAPGADQVEFDVHRTADGGLVVLHDATLERTTTGTGPVAALELDEIRRLRLRDRPEETVPTFEEVLDLLAPAAIGLRVEIKPGVEFRRYAGIETAVVAALRARGLLERSVITSFLLPILEAAAAAGAPRLLWLVAPIVQASLGSTARLTDLARAAGVGELGLHIDRLDAATVASVRAAGLEIGAWAAHEDAQIAKALEFGLSVFTTDRPSAALAGRRARLAGARDAR